MMKKQFVGVFFCLVILGLMVPVTGCKKEDVPKQCWSCEINGMFPQYNKVVTQCVEKEADLDLQWEDPMGNEQNVLCTKQ